MDGEAGKGQSGTDAPFVFGDKVLVGVSRRRIRRSPGWSPAPIISRTALRLGAAIPRDLISDTLIDPAATMALGKPVGADSSTLDVARRPMEDRRRRDLGLFLRS